jgi:monoamine oxidase
MAGSDVAPEHAGWIAGAIASGRKVASELAEQLRPEAADQDATA